jgi:hypothetical protein
MRNSSLTCCGGAFLNFGIAYPARDNVNPRWLKSRLRCFGNGSINVAISEATSMLKQHKVNKTNWIKKRLRQILGIIFASLF